MVRLVCAWSKWRRFQVQRTQQILQKLSCAFKDAETSLVIFLRPHPQLHHMFWLSDFYIKNCTSWNTVTWESQSCIFITTNFNKTFESILNLIIIDFIFIYSTVFNYSLVVESYNLVYDYEQLTQKLICHNEVLFFPFFKKRDDVQSVPLD